MREMRRLGATEEEALEGRRAPGVDALEDAKPTEVSELELQAVQSLVTGGVPRRRAALHLERLLHSLAAGVLRLLRLLGGHDACARVDSTAVAAPLERCLRVPLALELDAGGVASLKMSAPRCDRARDRDPTRPNSDHRRFISAASGGWSESKTSVPVTDSRTRRCHLLMTRFRPRQTLRILNPQCTSLIL